MVRTTAKSNKSSYDIISGQEYNGPRQLRTGKRRVEGRVSTSSDVTIHMNPSPPESPSLRVSDKTIIFNSSYGVASSINPTLVSTQSIQPQSQSHHNTHDYDYDQFNSSNKSTSSLTDYNLLSPSHISQTSQIYNTHNLSGNEYSPFLPSTPTSPQKKRQETYDGLIPIRHMSPHAVRLSHSRGVADALGAQIISSPALNTHGYLVTTDSLDNTPSRSHDNTTANTTSNNTASTPTTPTKPFPGERMMHHNTPKKSGQYHNSISSDSTLCDTLSPTMLQRVRPIPSDRPPRKIAECATGASTLSSVAYLSTLLSLAQRDGLDISTQGDMLVKLHAEETITDSKSKTSTIKPVRDSVASSLKRSKESCMEHFTHSLSHILPPDFDKSNPSNVAKIGDPNPRIIPKGRADSSKLGHGRGKSHVQGRQTDYNILSPTIISVEASRRDELLPQQQSTLSINHPTQQEDVDKLSKEIETIHLQKRDNATQVQRIATEQRFGYKINPNDIKPDTRLQNHLDNNPKFHQKGVTGTISCELFPSMCMGADIPTLPSLPSIPTLPGTPDIVNDVNTPTNTSTNVSLDTKSISTFPNREFHDSFISFTASNNIQAQHQLDSSTVDVSDTASTSTIMENAPFGSSYNSEKIKDVEVPIQDNFIKGVYVSPDLEAHRYKPSNTSYQLSSDIDNSTYNMGDIQYSSSIDSRDNTYETLESRALGQTSFTYRDQDDVVEAQRMNFQFAKSTTSFSNPGSRVASAANSTQNSTQNSGNVTPNVSRPHTPSHRHTSTLNTQFDTSNIKGMMTPINEGNESAKKAYDPLSFEKAIVEKPKPLQPTPEQRAQREIQRQIEEQEKTMRRQRQSERELVRQKQEKAQQRAQIQAEKQALANAQALALARLETQQAQERERQTMKAAEEARLRVLAYESRPQSPLVQLNSHISSLHSLLSENSEKGEKNEKNKPISQPIAQPDTTSNAFASTLPTNKNQHTMRTNTSASMRSPQKNISVPAGGYTPTRALRTQVERPKPSISLHETIKQWN